MHQHTLRRQVAILVRVEPRLTVEKVADAQEPHHIVAVGKNSVEDEDGVRELRKKKDDDPEGGDEQGGQRQRRKDQLRRFGSGGGESGLSMRHGSLFRAHGAAATADHRQGFRDSRDLSASA